MLIIKNWEAWQTYRKDRGTPPWIKVHRNLMSNPDWAVLSDAEKGQLVSIWICAADKGGKIPSCPKILQKICQLDNPPDIDKLLSLGFLSSACQPDDKRMTTTCPQDDAPEAEAEADIIINAREDLKPDEVSKQTWEDFKKLRKNKKAPITKTALNKIINEAKKTNLTMEEALQEMCSRGWVGFNAEWVNKGDKNGSTRQSYRTSNKSDRAKEAIQRGLDSIPSAGSYADEPRPEGQG